MYSATRSSGRTDSFPASAPRSNGGGVVPSGIGSSCSRTTAPCPSRRTGIARGGWWRVVPAYVAYQDQVFTVSCYVVSSDKLGTADLQGNLNGADYHARTVSGIPPD